jgi:hypothetical protein
MKHAEDPGSVDGMEADCAQGIDLEVHWISGPEIQVLSNFLWEGKQTVSRDLASSHGE